MEVFQSVAHLYTQKSYDCYHERVDHKRHFCVAGSMLQALRGDQVQNDAPRGPEAVHNALHQPAPLRATTPLHVAAFCALAPICQQPLMHK